MGGEVIKEFLVGLGFSLDEGELSKFNKAITESSLKIAAFSAGISAAATGVFAGITGISKDFESLGYEMRLVAPALNKMLLLRQAMLNAYSRAGVDLTKVVQQSIAFNFSLDKTKIALEAIYKSVGAKFLPLLTKQMDIFRSKIYANLPKIQAFFEKMIQFIFKAFEAVVQLGSTLYGILSRVYDFFVELDHATGGWSTKILAVIALWKLLNLEFLATPLGALLAGFVSLLALYDDFKVFMEGGKSLFDWTPFLPVIKAVGDAISSVKAVLDGLFTLLFDVIGAWSQLFDLDFDGFKESVKNIFGDIVGYVDTLVNAFKSLFGVGTALQNFLPSVLGYASNQIGKLFGGGNAAPNLNSALQPQPLVNSSNATNQKVHQETTINVNSSANAVAVGNHVASLQGGVNFDLTRNLIGATR